MCDIGEISSHIHIPFPICCPICARGVDHIDSTLFSFGLVCFFISCPFTFDGPGPLLPFILSFCGHGSCDREAPRPLLACTCRLTELFFFFLDFGYARRSRFSYICPPRTLWQMAQARDIPTCWRTSTAGNRMTFCTSRRSCANLGTLLTSFGSTDGRSPGWTKRGCGRLLQT